MKIIIFGVTGMMGHVLFQYFSTQNDTQVWGTIRDPAQKNHFLPPSRDHLIQLNDIQDNTEVLRLLQKVKPDLVINCIGVIKQLASSNNPLVVIPVNSVWPHQLARHCQEVSARMIHFSTDCVFSGKKGNYTELDNSDATDLYGRSKFLGEVTDQPHVLTLRSSFIGHELANHYSLVDWFLFQQGPIKGYTRAIYSGLPTIEVAHLIHQLVLRPNFLSGLYQVATQPISKYDLLTLIGQVYHHSIIIEPDDSVIIDRSLNGTLFEQATGYQAPSWPVMIEQMYESNQKWRTYVS